MTKRWFYFLLAILIGFIGGLMYAWRLNPVEYVETRPETLRIDFKTDYVLMVAEAYTAERNLELAVQRLMLLGESSPGEAIQKALTFGEQNGYAEPDLVLMRGLAAALQGWIPGVSTPIP